jgi:hypothetical protein
LIFAAAIFGGSVNVDRSCHDVRHAAENNLPAHEEVL